MGNDRNVVLFTEELTSTKESKIILLESATTTTTTRICRNKTNDNGKENPNSNDQVVVSTDKDVPYDTDTTVTKKKTTKGTPQQAAASPTVYVLKNRSTNESSSPSLSPSSTSSIPAK